MNSNRPRQFDWIMRKSADNFLLNFRRALVHGEADIAPFVLFEHQKVVRPVEFHHNFHAFIGLFDALDGGNFTVKIPLFAARVVLQKHDLRAFFQRQSAVSWVHKFGKFAVNVGIVCINFALQSLQRRLVEFSSFGVVGRQRDVAVFGFWLKIGLIILV